MNKLPCEVVRDLLPLYADQACSDESRRVVEEHLQECPDCKSMLQRLQDGRIEENLRTERTDVIEYSAKRFRKRSAAVGSTISGLFMIPILVCLIINITAGAGMGWFFIMLAAMGVAASLILVPILAPESKLFWTFCAFCASLVLLLATICLYSRGTWFWIASSASLFGLAVVFLPFVVRTRPVRKLIGSISPVKFVLIVDAALFMNMMHMIRNRGKLTTFSTLFTVCVFAGIWLVISEINRRRKK